MKLAIIGTGKIAVEALSALQAVHTVETVAIFGRPHSAEKAGALAAQYAISEVYTDYRQLLSSTRADTVYIALINSAHFPYAREALLAGKHVILEKPFTGRYEEAKELAALAGERGLFLFEAATVLHGDVLPAMREALPALGSIRLVQASFCQYSSRYDAYLNGTVDPMLDPAHFGGALYDLNVYNLYYCVSLFGRPGEVHYFPNRGFNGCDTSGILVLRHDGFTCTLTAAKDCDGPSHVTIQGEHGTLRLSGKPNVATDLTLTGRGQAGEPSGSVTLPVSPVHHRMEREFADFAAILASCDHDACDALLKTTLSVMWVLDRARATDGMN